MCVCAEYVLLAFFPSSILFRQKNAYRIIKAENGRSLEASSPRPPLVKKGHA